MQEPLSVLRFVVMNERGVDRDDAASRWRTLWERRDADIFAVFVERITAWRATELDGSLIYRGKPDIESRRSFGWQPEIKEAKKPNGGLEPPALRLRVSRSTD